MTKTIKTLVTLALVFGTSIAMACEYPAPPKDMPDGSVATKDEMLVGVKKIADYQKTMTEYLSCIEADQVVTMQSFAEEDEDAKNTSRANFNKKYNAAVDEQTRTVEMFNLEIREYKAR